MARKPVTDPGIAALLNEGRRTPASPAAGPAPSSDTAGPADPATDAPAPAETLDPGVVTVAHELAKFDVARRADDISQIAKDLMIGHHIPGLDQRLLLVSHAHGPYDQPWDHGVHRQIFSVVLAPQDVTDAEAAQKARLCDGHESVYVKASVPADHVPYTTAGDALFNAMEPRDWNSYFNPEKAVTPLRPPDGPYSVSRSRS